MTWLALLLAVQNASGPAASPAGVAVRAQARIVAAVKVVGGRVEAAPLVQMRTRPGLRLAEFQ